MCVLSNADLSNALTKTGICTFIKYLAYFYFRFHPILSTRWALFFLPRELCLVRYMAVYATPCVCVCVWATFVKRFALCYQTVVCPVCLSVLSVLSVCNVGVLWPNGCMDHDETWHAGRPRPLPHCLRWGPSSPSRTGHSPQFSVHICCGQMAA